MVITQGNEQTAKTNPVEYEKRILISCLMVQLNAGGSTENKHVATADTPIEVLNDTDMLKTIAGNNANVKKYYNTL